MNRVKTLGALLLSVLLLPLSTALAQEEYQQEPLEDPTLYYQQTVSDYSDYFDDSTVDIDPDEYLTNTMENTAAAWIATVFAGGLILVWSAIGLASYVYSALALMKIGRELGYQNPWYAWIPILNIIMLFNLGNQNPWLILLMLIPGIGALIVGIFTIIALANIAEKRGYDKLIALLSLIPLGAYVLLYLLAWKPKK